MDEIPDFNLLCICCKTLQELNTFVFENNLDVKNEFVKNYRDELLLSDNWLETKVNSFTEPYQIDQFERSNPLFRGLPCLLQKKRQLKLEQV